MQKLKRFYPVASGLLSDRPVPLVSAPPVVLASDVVILEALCDSLVAQLGGVNSTIAQMNADVISGLVAETTNHAVSSAAKSREIERLKAESTPNDELWKLLPGTYYMDPPDGGDVPLLVQLQRMAADAAKWRKWLSEGKCDD